jgi:hypothetical protein
MEILNRLNRSYPIAENETERGVQELLGPINKRIVHQAMEDPNTKGGKEITGPTSIIGKKRTRLSRNQVR